MVLITGATGLVGSHLALDLLKKGVNVKAVKRSKSNMQNTLKVFSYYEENAKKYFEKIEWVDANLNDALEVDELLNDIDEVYHCAAMVSFSPKDKKALLKYNPNITANLVNASLLNKIKKFCFISSVAVLDKSEKVTNETHYWKSDPEASVYGKSKYLSEMEVWRGVEEGLNGVIVNPSLILGPGNWEGSSSVLFNTAYKGMPFYTEGTNGFVDVKDVVQAATSLMDKNIFGQRFILNSQNVPLRQVFTEMAKLFNKKPPHIKSPKRLSELLWRMEWLRTSLFGGQPVLTKETVNTASKTTLFSNQKIIDALDINFIPVKESIEKYCGFYLNDLKRA